MNFTSRTRLTIEDKNQLIRLWNSEYPKDLTFTDLSEFDTYINGLDNASHRLVINDQEQIMGWYFDFDRDGERWFAILLNSDIQGLGIGRQLLNAAKNEWKTLHAWVIDHNNDKKLNGDWYISPLPFYIKNGFQVKGTRLDLTHISAVQINWTK